MELANIEKLLEAYFEGNTTLAQEQELRVHFRSEELPPHLEVYRPMFMGFDIAREETSEREFTLPEPKKRNRFWNLSIAASLLLAVGISAYMFTQSGTGLTAEEEEALAAFQKTKETMFLLSENLNEGTESLTHLEEFSSGLSSLNVLNQFNESKNLILK
ncbi:MAG: hypothetical protein AAFP76_16770 [Bacteroidota bacterium]